MKQPHTEQSVKHTDDQQNTGNHRKPDAPRMPAAPTSSAAPARAPRMWSRRPARSSMVWCGLRAASLALPDGRGGC